MKTFSTIVAALLLPGALFGAPPATPPAPSIMLKTDPDLDALIAQARQLVETGQYRAAIDLYQGIIEKGGDRVVAATATNAGANESANLFLPAPAAARQALQIAPLAMRAAYVAANEPQAARRVEDALVARDPVALHRIAQQFPITPAAQRARWWCASLLADIGNFATAAAIWDEFLQLQPASGDGGADVAITLTQQALALARSGYAIAARENLARLQQDFAGAKRTIGGETRDVVEFTAQSLESSTPTKADEILVSDLAPSPRWAVEEAEGLSPYLTISAGRVFIRSQDQLTCRESASGKLLWHVETATQATLETPQDGPRVVANNDDRDTLELHRFAVAAMPEAVYYVEKFPNIAKLTEAGGMPGGPARQNMSREQRFASSSQLAARDAATGKLVWRVGRGEGRDDFIRLARWISAPAVERGRVYAIALYIQSYYLACLDAADGRLLWSSFISQRPELGMGWPGAADLDRPSTPCVAGGRVFCLTNAGVLGCFDQLTGDAEWLYQYLGRPSNLRAALLRATASRNGIPTNSIFVDHRTAIVAPADAEEVIAIDPASGRVRWTRGREERQFLAGITRPADADQPRLVILTGAGAAGLRFDTGDTAWTVGIDAANCRPVLHDATLLLVQHGRGIVRMDAGTGHEISCSPVETDDYRHIIADGGALLAVGERAAAAFWSYRDAVAAITARIEADPHEPRWWIKRGELNLQSGHAAEALEDLQKARALSVPAARSVASIDVLLFRCHVALALSHPPQTLAWLNRAAVYATTPATRSERWLRLADAHAARGEWSAAADAFQRILDEEPDAWIDWPASRSDSGARLAGGRVSNRATATRHLEELVAAHGENVYAHHTAVARRRLLDATRHADAPALLDLIERYPVGESCERAWLALAQLRFNVKQFDRAAETLQQFLRSEQPPAHAADAMLGLALAGLRGGRPVLACYALHSLAAVPANARASFADVTGTVGALAHQLQHDAAPPPSTKSVAASNKSVLRERQPIAISAGDVTNIAGSLLFLQGHRDHSGGETTERCVVRVESLSDQDLWVSAPVFEMKSGTAGPAYGALVADSIIVGLGAQLAALDAETGKLLWQRSPPAGSPSPPGLPTKVMRVQGGMVRMSVSVQPPRPESNTPLTLFAGDQLLNVAPNGAVAGISPRHNEPLWRVHLPPPASQWSNARPQLKARYLALLSNVEDQSPGRQVAVVDVWRGRLAAIWTLPDTDAEFTVLADGRIALKP